jgi:hypothetical protein
MHIPAGCCLPAEWALEVIHPLLAMALVTDQALEPPPQPQQDGELLQLLMQLRVPVVGCYHRPLQKVMRELAVTQQLGEYRRAGEGGVVG